jgi:hypothetical protein
LQDSFGAQARSTSASHRVPFCVIVHCSSGVVFGGSCVELGTDVVAVGADVSVGGGVTTCFWSSPHAGSVAAMMTNEGAKMRRGMWAAMFFVDNHSSAPLRERLPATPYFPKRASTVAVNGKIGHEKPCVVKMNNASRQHWYPSCAASSAHAAPGTVT